MWWGILANGDATTYGSSPSDPVGDLRQLRAWVKHLELLDVPTLLPGASPLTELTLLQLFEAAYVTGLHLRTYKSLKRTKEASPVLASYST